MDSIPNDRGSMVSSSDIHEFGFDAEAASRNTYSPRTRSGFESTQGFREPSDYSRPRKAEGLSYSFPSFAGGPTYPNASQQIHGGKQSPHLCNSSEIQNLSSGSSATLGALASSSPWSSYSSRSQTASASDWTSGLRINPSTISAYGKSFAQEANDTTSGMEHKLFSDRHISVSECSDIPESLSSKYPLLSSSFPMDLIENCPDNNYPYTRRSTQSTISIITPSSSSSGLFESPAIPFSTSFPSFSFQGNSSTAGQTQDFQFSPIFPKVQSFDQPMVEPSSYPPSHPSQFSSHTSCQFVAPLNCSGLFPVSIQPSNKLRRKGKCHWPKCGKIFKDLKAHMLTHQDQRPEKCPIADCSYSTKGFARKYDKNRHILTHYKGTMVCSFCLGSGSTEERSFSRADVFKRHLTFVHAVERTSSNNSKKASRAVISSQNPADNTPISNGKCSTCLATFQSPQHFYEHLDGCVLRTVQRGDPQPLAGAGENIAVHDMPWDRDLHATAINRNWVGEKDQDEPELWV
jgi:hypothetical protein